MNARIEKHDLNVASRRGVSLTDGGNVFKDPLFQLGEEASAVKDLVLNGRIKSARRNAELSIARFYRIFDLVASGFSNCS